MIALDLAITDQDGKHQTATIRATQGDQHPKLRQAYYYDYRANVDHKLYTGSILHSPAHGAVSLAQKITKDIVSQQKAVRV